jgi:hypothetical protein
MDKPIKEIKVNGLTVKIFQDMDPNDPRKDFDPAGTLICFHSRYDLGDDHKFASPSEVEEFLKNNDCIWLPVFLYDHGGISISTGPFGCPWDSGQVGVIFIAKEKALKEFGAKRMTKVLKEKVLSLLKAEIKEYNDFLTGDVFGFVIEKEETCEHCHNSEAKHIDSCWGFIGDIDYCEKRAISIAKRYRE